MRYARAITLTDAVVGFSPGRTTDVQAGRPERRRARREAAAPRLASGSRSSQLDTVSVARTFYASHPDLYDQLMIWTDARIIQDAFAFESTVANEIQGIGQEIFDFSRDFGSAGRLQSYAIMDFLGKYPDDPTQRFLGEDNTLSVLAHEVGHRWLAYFNFLDHTGQQSDALLGRQRATGASSWTRTPR